MARMLTFAWRPDGRRLRSALRLAALCLAPAVALAHTQPRAIEEWGPFMAETMPCLQTMSRATHACFDTVLNVEQACRDAQARGETCDMAQVVAVTDAATLQMRRSLTTECQQGQLTEVGYFGFFDAEADMFNACVIQSRAAVTATYAPAVGAPSPAALDCMAATAAYARKVMRFALEHQTPVMERIAARFLEEEERLASVRRMREMLSTARARWITGLLEVCPEFATVYGRTPENYLRTLQHRTDCVLSKTFVNTAVSCLAQVCGNGIPEASEACDDGNNNNTDACATNCRINP
jgi:cysteine-rich repeat protein